MLAGLLGIVEDLTKIYEEPILSHLHCAKRNLVKTNGEAPGRVANFFYIFSSVHERGMMESYQKFSIQSAISGFAAYWTYFKLGWDYIWFPLQGNVHIGIFYPLFIFLFFVFVLNAVAFTDGLDGLLGGLTLTIMLGFWVIAAKLEYNTLATYCATIIGSLLPFLYFNIPPPAYIHGECRVPFPRSFHGNLSYCVT